MRNRTNRLSATAIVALAVIAALGWIRQPVVDQQAPQTARATFAAPAAIAIPTPTPVGPYWQDIEREQLVQAPESRRVAPRQSAKARLATVPERVEHRPAPDVRTESAAAGTVADEPEAARENTEEEVRSEDVAQAPQVQKRSKKKSAAVILGSAAAGAAIGGVAGGGKGAVIGAATGAAGGFVYDRVTRYDDDADRPRGERIASRYATPGFLGR